MNIIKRVLYILRYSLGLILFALFINFATGQGNCNTPSCSTSTTYIVFFLIVIVLILELGYIIVRTRSLETNNEELKIIARAGLFLFDSIYIMLATVTAFAVLYTQCNVINMECITGRDALYFSMVTFTTLGYGDILPNDQFKIIVAGEAILGYIVLGLIVGYAGSLFNIDSKK